MVLLDAIKSLEFDLENSAVLSPDVGSARMSQSYAKKLGMHFALIDKRRYAPNKAQVMHLIGDLKNKDVLIIDDMIDTAGTTVNAANAAIAEGAKSVTAVATHGVLSGPAIERLSGSSIKKVIITDTISISEDKKKITFLKDCKGNKNLKIFENFFKNDISIMFFAYHSNVKSSRVMFFVL